MGLLPPLALNTSLVITASVHLSQYTKKKHIGAPAERSPERGCCCARRTGYRRHLYTPPGTLSKKLPGVELVSIAHAYNGARKASPSSSTVLVLNAAALQDTATKSSSASTRKSTHSDRHTAREERTRQPLHSHYTEPTDMRPARTTKRVISTPTRCQQTASTQPRRASLT